MPFAKQIHYAFDMIFKEVPLENIDFGDQRFRISEELDCSRLEESLRQVGQLQPVHLRERDGSLDTIISGFRRLRALQKLGRSRVLARIWQEPGLDNLQAFQMGLWENLSHRDLNALEKARALVNLRQFCDVPHDTVVEVYLPLLGLEPHKNVLRTYLLLHELSPALRKMFLECRITLASAGRLAGTPREFQERFASILLGVNWSSSLQREVLDLVEELSAINNCSLLDVLNGPEIVGVLADTPLSPFQRGERIRGILFRHRNPKLAQAHERFIDQQKRLGLPGSIRIIPDPYFENSRVKIEFEVSTGDEFRRVAEALRFASRVPALDELFHSV